MAQNDPYYDQERYWSPIYDGHGYDSPSTPTSLTDGHPLSSTASAAQETAVESAILDPEQADEEFSQKTVESSDAATQMNSLGAELGTGSYDIDGMKADVYTVRIPWSHTFGDRDKLSLTLPISITNLKDVLAELDASNVLHLSDASVYGYGLNAAYTRKVITKADNVPYRWNLTPSAGYFVRESSDMNLGSRIFNFGLSSSFAYQFSPGWIVNVGNSISYSTSSGIKTYPDPIRDEQQVAVNGLQLIRMTGRWTFSAYIMDTRYFQTENTYVSNFQSYALSAGFQITQKRSIKLSVVAESGEDYSSFRGMLGSTWKF
ncbi:MAG: hypothetical protein WC360_02445 [Opitutales bacterium]|jgi:hypothetical protein